MKKCWKCKEQKPKNEFYKCLAEKDGFQKACKVCQQQMQRFIKYGLTPAAYDALYNAQKGRCLICNRHNSECIRGLVIDHCHFSGDIRGLLCEQCNKGLGHFSDSPSLFRKAAQYLEGR